MRPPVIHNQLVTQIQPGTILRANCEKIISILWNCNCPAPAHHEVLHQLCPVEIILGGSKINLGIDPDKPRLQPDRNLEFISQLILKLEIFTDQARSCCQREHGKEQCDVSENSSLHGFASGESDRR